MKFSSLILCFQFFLPQTSPSLINLQTNHNQHEAITNFPLYTLIISIEKIFTTNLLSTQLRRNLMHITACSPSHGSDDRWITRWKIAENARRRLTDSGIQRLFKLTFLKRA